MVFRWIPCVSLMALLYLSAFHLSASKALAMPSEAATKTLEQVEAFESSRIGFAAQLSEPLVELFDLLANGNTRVGLDQLFSSGTHAAQFYALLGASLIGDDDLIRQFQVSLKAKSLNVVSVMDGCMLHEITVGDLLTRWNDPDFLASYRQEYENWLAKP